MFKKSNTPILLILLCLADIINVIINIIITIIINIMTKIYFFLDSCLFLHIFSIVSGTSFEPDKTAFLSPKFHLKNHFFISNDDCLIISSKLSKQCVH